MELYHEEISAIGDIRRARPEPKGCPLYTQESREKALNGYEDKSGIRSLRILTEAENSQTEPEISSFLDPGRKISVSDREELLSIIDELTEKNNGVNMVFEGLSGKIDRARSRTLRVRESLPRRIWTMR